MSFALLSNNHQPKPNQLMIDPRLVFNTSVSFTIGLSLKQSSQKHLTGGAMNDETIETGRSA